jgi:two-component system NtrC family response regulator
MKLAHGGTLFIREVGDLPGAAQVALHQAMRDGARRGPDVRLVCSSAMDLDSGVGAGSFHAELLSLLRRAVIPLAPLRERVQDIPVLARLFLLRACRELGKETDGFTDEALAAMAAHDWPGNVRELENRVKRAAIIAASPLVTVEELGLRETGGEATLSLRDARRDLDVRYIRMAMQKTRGNVSRAAVELGITRVCLHDLLNKYSLRRP